jgi:fucose 4-O-acetylase-like acetyltransferase
MNPKERRSATVDIAKGIAILLVVYGHSLRGMIYAGLLPDSSWLIPTNYLVYTFHMPLFFLLSGLFFRSSADKGPRAFWTGRLKSIVYPYFLWSLFQGGFQLALAGTGAVNSTFHLSDLLGILWRPIVPFWFLYALFFANAIAMLVRRVKIFLVVAGALLGFLVATRFAPDIVGDIAYGFLYFSLGILMRERDLLRRIPATWTMAGILSLAFLGTAIACYLLKVPERLPLPATLLGMLATLAVSRVLDETSAARPFARILQGLGRCSMSIYVLHILILGFVRTLCLRFLGIHDPLLLMPPAIATAVVVPVAIQLAGTRMGINAWMGFPAVADPFSATGKGPGAGKL